MPKISILTVVSAGMLVACANHSFAQAPFKPPEVTSASDMPFPIQSIADGVVVVDASLGDKGAITGTSVVRDVPSLTSPAISAIRTWKFSPAMRLGKSEPSTMRVAVVFRPRS